MSRVPRVAVVGSANVDLTTFSDTFPRPGETLFGQRFDLGFGGKGANQAVTARICGAEVLAVAKRGHHRFGQATGRNFPSSGMYNSHMRIVYPLSRAHSPTLLHPNRPQRALTPDGP